MFTGPDPDPTQDGRVVGRLLAAGMLQKGKAGLTTTERWQSEMLRELSAHPGDPIQESLEHTLTDSFPGMPVEEIDAMARIMLHIEAREAGWKGE